MDYIDSFSHRLICVSGFTDDPDDDTRYHWLTDPKEQDYEYIFSETVMDGGEFVSTTENNEIILDLIDAGLLEVDQVF